MRSILLYVILLLTIPLLAFAEDGYIFGENHCFYFSAPTGWVADGSSGKNQGLVFVFYPSNSSWSKATTVIYPKVVDMSKNLKEPKDQVAQTLELFHTKYKSPNSKAEKAGTIQSLSGAFGEFYKFTGDQWGNTELVVYFKGRETINYFVMTSRDAADLEKNRTSLEEIAKSYREANDCKPCDQPKNIPEGIDDNAVLNKLPDSLSEAKKLGDKQEKAAATRDYHNKHLMPYFGNKYAGILKRCFDTISKPDDRAFTFVVAINSDGIVLRIYRDLETNIFQCMTDSLIKDQFPKPPVAPYFLNIEMKFTP